jgi:uncharacterized membrane protein
MLLIHQWLVWGHIVAGSLALALFWLPMLAKKGSPLHRQSGRYYAYLLYGVSMSGLVSSVMVIAAPLYFKAKLLKEGVDPSLFAENIRASWHFLGLLSLLSWVAIRQAVLVLKTGLDRQLLKQPLHVVAVAALAPWGAYVLWLGIDRSQPLLIIFSLLAIASAVTGLRVIFRAEVTKMMLLREHIGNMLGSGIAIYTAFAAFGGRSVLELSDTGQLVSWLLPSVIGVSFTVWYNRRYQDQPKTILVQSQQ